VVSHSDQQESIKNGRQTTLSKRTLISQKSKFLLCELNQNIIIKKNFVTENYECCKDIESILIQVRSDAECTKNNLLCNNKTTCLLKALADFDLNGRE